MSTRAPSTDDRKSKGLPDISSSQPRSFWSPQKLVATALAVIAAVAGLIGDLSGIFQFMQPSLSGRWLLTTNIKQSPYREYIGKTATFEIFLVNEGQNLTGSGEKILVDGKGIPTGQRRPIKVEGQISSSNVILTYEEKPGPDGRARETSGQFMLKVIRAGIASRRAARMEGTFCGTAAATTGIVTAEPKLD